MRTNNSYTEYMFSFIKRICEEIGPRPATSVNEAKAAQEIKKEFSKYCDETVIEKFECRPGGFLGFLNILAILHFIALIFYFHFPIISLILAIFSLFVYVLEINHLKEFVDPLFRKGASENVIGKIKPKNQTRKIVIFGAHHDSPVEFPLPIKLRRKTLVFVRFMTIFIALTLLVYGLKALRQILSLFYPNVEFLGIVTASYLVIIPIIGFAFTLMLRFGLKSNTQTLGANDNLSGVAVILGIARYLSQNRPKNVEILVISFGCEECMRGSKRFVNKHWKGLANSYTINFDTAGSGYIKILSEEKMYRARHSLELCKKLQKAAEKCEIGYPVEIFSGPFGGTDSAFFSRKGLPATSIVGLAEDGFLEVWHTRRDTPERIEKDNLSKLLEIGLQFVEDVDKEF